MKVCVWNMADKGSVLTSVIIFYLSIGAAIFQILEEPNWKRAVETYHSDKQQILKKHPCLTSSDLENIIEIVAKAAGQGVTVTGENHFDCWKWQNALVFAATIITTIGYGYVSPKTVGGRIFCIIFGLFGIPLCLTWISELGSFFGSRAKRLSQVLLHKGFSVKRVQFICTTLFLLWGLLFHLLIPSFILMMVEKWTYLEGLYFCFITLTTVGFGDYVAGANPNLEYQALYRVGVELWIYMGLAWLSLFFSWNVHMVVKAHKVLKKRRQMRHKYPYELDPIRNAPLPHRASIVDIFNFMSEKGEDYSDVIRAIGTAEKRKKQLKEELTRSKSCSDLLKEMVVPLEQSPQQKRRFSIGDNVYMVISRVRGSTEDLEEQSTPQDAGPEPQLDEESFLEKGASSRVAHSRWDGRKSTSLILRSPPQWPRINIIPAETSGSLFGSRFSVNRVSESDPLQKDSGPG